MKHNLGYLFTCKTLAASTEGHAHKMAISARPHVQLIISGHKLLYIVTILIYVMQLHFKIPLTVNFVSDRYICRSIHMLWRDDGLQLFCHLRYARSLVVQAVLQGRTQDLEFRGGASGVSRISARGVLKVRPHTKSGGGGGGGEGGGGGNSLRVQYEKWGGGGGGGGNSLQVQYEKWGGGGGGAIRFRSDTKSGGTFRFSLRPLFGT